MFGEHATRGNAPTKPRLAIAKMLTERVLADPEKSKVAATHSVGYTEAAAVVMGI